MSRECYVKILIRIKLVCFTKKTIYIKQHLSYPDIEAPHPNPLLEGEGTNTIR